MATTARIAGHRRNEVQVIMESDAFRDRLGIRVRSSLSDMHIAILALLAQSGNEYEAISRYVTTLLKPHIDQVVEEIRSEKS